MTMHLEGPWLTMTGKRKTKRRWTSAEQKRKHDELEASWQAIKAKHAPRTTVSATKSNVYKPPRPLYRGSDQPRLPSLDTGVKGAVTVRAPQQYTGTKVKGIATMHKSNAVPVFTDEQAVDISRMRRG